MLLKTCGNGDGYLHGKGHHSTTIRTFENVFLELGVSWAEALTRAYVVARTREKGSPNQFVNAVFEMCRGPNYGRRMAPGHFCPPYFDLERGTLGMWKSGTNDLTVVSTQALRSY